MNARPLPVPSLLRMVHTPANSETVHVPVLQREVLSALQLRAGLCVVDGTLGGAGHALSIRNTILPGGRLIGLDRDPAAIERVASRWHPPDVSFVARSYRELPEVLGELGLTPVDRIFVDLGLSSDQLADESRGFSFHADGPLDLRFDPTQGSPAAEWIATRDAQELSRIFAEYGEEPAANRIAEGVVRARAREPITSAKQLARIIEEIVGKSSAGERHPATRIFQSLRIAVNSELEHVEQSLLSAFPRSLKPDGLLAVITFHSLEDRLVKQVFRDSPLWEVVTPKPIVATPAEVRFNPRSRSAKLRVARRTQIPIEGVQSAIDHSGESPEKE